MRGAALTPLHEIVKRRETGHNLMLDYVNLARAS
jgi:hypothetical protein